MRNSLPSLESLRVLAACVRHGNFSRAAAELGITPTAVSQRMRALEAELGIKLFRRHGPKLTTTDRARALGARLEHALALMRAAVEDCRRLKPPLRVTCAPTFAARWLVPRLGDFSIKHPQIELELETSDEFRVLGTDADLAIRYISAASRRPRTRSRRLFSMEGVPVTAGVRPRPSQWRRDQAVTEYRLLHDDNGSAWRSWFAAAGLAGFERARHLYFTDYSLAIDAAERGQGVALGAAAFIEPELRSGRLAHMGQTRVPFGEYFLLESRERSTAALRDAFVRWLMNEIGRPSPHAPGEPR